MGLAIETVFGSMDAAAATGLQPYVPANGQTFQVRACNGPTPAHLETLWGSVTDPGFARIRSPRMHDDVNGVQAFVQATDPSPVIDEYFENTLFSQDFLTVEGLFLAAPTAHDINQLAFNVYYDDIPGLAANFLPWAQVKSLMDSAPVRNQYSGVYVEPITNATVGQFGVGVALNSSQDVWKANSLYALIGYEVDQEFTGFTLQGTDLGNLQFGGPGSLDPKITRSWFVDQEMKTGRPSIPVINSQNKQSTLVSAFGATATTTVTVNLVFAYCGPASVS